MEIVEFLYDILRLCATYVIVGGLVGWFMECLHFNYIIEL